MDSSLRCLIERIAGVLRDKFQRREDDIAKGRPMFLSKIQCWSTHSSGVPLPQRLKRHLLWPLLNTGPQTTQAPFTRLLLCRGAFVRRSFCALLVAGHNGAGR
jgi:hypothetical protein